MASYGCTDGLWASFSGPFNVNAQDKKLVQRCLIKLQSYSIKAWAKAAQCVGINGPMLQFDNRRVNAQSHFFLGAHKTLTQIIFIRMRCENLRPNALS